MLIKKGLIYKYKGHYKEEIVLVLNVNKKFKTVEFKIIKNENNTNRVGNIFKFSLKFFKNWFKIVREKNSVKKIPTPH